MYEYAIAWDWLTFAVRWLHVITGIAWIGSSFYFVALDLGLRQRPGLPVGAHGEEWQVHGGGFYHIQKYLVAPENMPEHLTWFKWESYVTWLSGFGMLALVYYAGADLYLIDPNVLDVSKPTAIAISLASLAFGWVAYDTICRSPLGNDNTRLMVLLYFVLVAVAWGYTQLYRARRLPAPRRLHGDDHVGQRVLHHHSEPEEGRCRPDRRPHARSGARQTGEAALDTQQLPDVACPVPDAVEPLSARLRHSIQLDHRLAGLPDGRHHPPLVQHAACPRRQPDLDVARHGAPFHRHHVAFHRAQGSLRRREARASTAGEAVIASPDFSKVRDTVLGRCSMCHAQEPGWEGIIVPPKGVVLETDGDIVAHAREIYLQAGRSHAMPPANVTGVTEEERQLLTAWYETAVKEGKIQ